MSHKCGRASSEKRLDVSKKQSKTTDIKCCSVSTVPTDSKYFNHSSKTDEQHKIKRLKTRKERSHTRGDWKETLKTKPYHHHCHRQIGKGAAFLQNCHNGCHWTSRKNTPVLSAIPVAQEPSIITDSRLIGHHGLFNHKVKSIDIERLLSNQSRLELSRQNVTEENNNSSNLSSGTHIPALLSSDVLLGADADACKDDVVPVSIKTSPVSKTHDVSQETEVKHLQGSDITPGQRLQQQLDPLSESFKTILSSEPSSHSEETTMMKTQKYFNSENKKTRQLTPSAGKDSVGTLNRKQSGHENTDLERPHKNQDHQTEADGLKPSPHQLSSSPTAESVDVQHRRQDPEKVSKTITAVAARLSGFLRLSVLKHSNLLAKSRKVLLKSLQESHGPWLQANLLELQRSVGHDINPTQTTLNQERIIMEEDQVLLANTSVPTTGSRCFTWESSPQPRQSLSQIAEDLSTSVDASVGFFDETFRPSLPPHFCMDFEPSGAATSDLFAPSPKFFQKEKAELWKESKSEESARFDSFPRSFMNHTKREVRETTCELQTGLFDVQPFFPFQPKHSAEPLQFHEERNLFEPARNVLAPSLSTRFHPHSQSRHFQPVDQPSARPSFRSRHPDMMLYPPSHMLERSLTPPPSSLLSPEHWSFPPMRLY